MSGLFHLAECLQGPSILSLIAGLRRGVGRGKVEEMSKSPIMKSHFIHVEKTEFQYEDSEKRLDEVDIETKPWNDKLRCVL